MPILTNARPLATAALLALALSGCARNAAPEAAGAAARPEKHASVPDRPEDITYPEVTFTPPLATDYRHEISPEGAGTVPVFVAPASDLPLVTVTFTFKGGAYLEPRDQPGLADLAAAMVVNGGTRSRSPEELDEAFAFLAANVSAQQNDTSVTVSLDVLRDNLDEALPLFLEMLREPGFDPSRTRLAVTNQVEAMKSRNDDAGGIAAREFRRLMFGESHLEARVATQDALESIDRADLEAFHAQVFHPGNLVVAVAGDVETDGILGTLKAELAGWTASERVADPEEPAHTPTPGLYHVQKDTPQGKVRIGLPGITRDHPDYFPLLVANEILGGGGFSSRIMARVRSDEGLAYGAWSSVSAPTWWPGTISAGFDSKNPTVALATSIVIEEMARLRTEPVPAAEVADAHAGMAAQLPRAFSSREAMLRYFVADEITGRDPSFWQTWEDNVRAVTADDVQRVASEHLKPDALVILVVGDWGPIAKGDVAGRATMESFGEVTHLPLRDPLTQVAARP